MKTNTLFDEIIYNLDTYLRGKLSAHAISSIGFEYFTKIESIPEIISNFEKYYIINDYKSIIIDMMFYVKKAFYQKQCDFSTFSKYDLNKAFEINLADVLISSDLEENCHQWCLNILTKCNYKY